MSEPPSDIFTCASSDNVVSEAVSPGRRDFLKLTAAAGATFLGDDDSPQALVTGAVSSFAKFDHMNSVAPMPTSVATRKYPGSVLITRFDRDVHVRRLNYVTRRVERSASRCTSG